MGGAYFSSAQNKTVVEKGVVRPVYPIKKTVSETPYDELQKSPVDLNVPSNIVTDIEYDVESGNYVMVTKVGDDKISTPVIMTPEEYLKYQQRKSSLNYWRSKNKIDYSKDKKDFDITDIQFDLGLGDKIFGEGGVKLRTRGSIEAEFSVKTNNVDNPSLSENEKRSTYFNFDQNIKMSVNGSVGDKVNMNMNYDTEATFDYDAKSIKLDYEGKEDEIIKSIEAGNVSMPLNSSLITGGSALFGIRTDLQFGKLSVSGLVAQQKSQIKSASTSGGSQKSEYEISIDNYDENQHFFLSHYFQSHYDRWAGKIPVVSSGINITKIEVWVTNKTNELDKARNIVAFTDLGEHDEISNPHWMQSGDIYPSNNSNSLYSEIISSYPGARNFSSVSTVFSSLNDQGVDIGMDYEKLENARLLSSSEYTLNTRLGYISINKKLRSDEILAVAYEYTRGGATYQVGEFSTDGISSPKTLFVKLLKGTDCSPSNPTWNLMMKNIYSIPGVYKLEAEDFTMDVEYQNDSVGTNMKYLTEGRIRNKLLINVLGLDRINKANQIAPDGVFDYVEGYTVQSDFGRIIFPSTEPFGSYLRNKIGDNVIADKYVFQELYDSTLTVAQEMPEKNKFVLAGKYKASSGATISLGAMNVARGSVIVTAGGNVLTENVDYTVNYMAGIVTIINADLINSGTVIKASCEDQSAYSTVRKTMLGLNLDYAFSDDFTLGGTILKLSEKPLTTKVDMGYETVNNTIFGVHTSYKTQSQFLTNVIDKIPFLTATEPSSLKINAEFARLVAGSSDELDQTSYIDDFESSKTSISLKDPMQWFLSSTPYDPSSSALFPEAAYSNDLKYGYNRSLLAWYIIDGIFTRTTSRTPGHIKNDDDLLSDNYVRAVYEKEIFPERSTTYNSTGLLSVMNLAYYPKERGPYNFDPDVDSEGELNDPEKRWGGIMRKISSGYTNFQSNNIEYIEFWVMDPFANDSSRNASGGDLYINLGEVSEDILKDGKRSFENGLPSSASDTSNIYTTAWGKVSGKTTTAYAFDNTSGIIEKQDLGLNGLTDDEEKNWPGIKDFVDKYKSRLSSTALARAEKNKFSPINDPGSDDFHYFRGSDYDKNKTGILERYKHYNGPQGNTSSSAGESYSTASTNLPDVEDINLDFTLNETEKYYQYKVSLRPEDMVFGENYISDVRTANVTLKNGKTESVKWYQFKIPVDEYQKKVGSISGFTSIRFIRMFLTGFQDSVVLRFATLSLVKGDWRTYTKDIYTKPPVTTSTSMDVSTVSYEENSGRTPIHYVLPPGVERETDPGQPGLYYEDEQSLALTVKELSPHDARAVYKNTSYDFRQYKRLQMFIHAEALPDDIYAPDDGDLSVFIRLGTDNKDNYYEYEVPLEMSPFYNNSPLSVWPSSNFINIPFSLLTKLKKNRNSALNASYSKLYSEYDPDNEQNKVSVIGNPSLSDVESIMIGIRNNSTEIKSAEIWADELRLKGYKDEGGYAAVGNAVVNLSDLGSLTVGGRYESEGWGGLEESVSERRKDTYSEYNMSFNFNFGKFFPEAVKLNVPFYYTYSKEKTLPKYDPLNEDLLLSNVLDAAKSGAAKDSISDYSTKLRTYKSYNFSNIRLNLKSKIPMIYDPANFSFNYSFNEAYNKDVDTKYEITRNYLLGANYSYSSPFKSWTPFDKAKGMKSDWYKPVKEFNINFFPNSISASTNLTRYYYEMQSRNLTSVNSDYAPPLSVSKNFLWNTSFDINWNITKNLKTGLSVNNKARVEETKTAPVNKELYRTEYENWKDTVKNSLRDFGTPLEYNQTVNVTYNVPLERIPVLDFMSLNSQYNAVYEWNRSASEVDDTTQTYMGNTISNQRILNFSSNANLKKLYDKSSFLKNLLKDDSRHNGRNRRKKESKTKKYEKKISLVSDSSFLVRHNLNNKRIDIVVVNKKGRDVKVKIKKKDKNSIFIKSKSDTTVKVIITQKPPVEKASWYKPARAIARVITSVTKVSGTYKQTDRMEIPGFYPETGIWGGSGRYGSAPGWDFALGMQSDDYLQKAIGKGWLVMNDSVNNPAFKMHSTDLRLKCTIKPVKDLNIELNTLRSWSYNSSIDYVYEDMHTTKTGSFSMSTIAIKTAFEKKHSDYSSKAFNRFLKNRAVIAERLNAKMEGRIYPDKGFLSGTPYAGEPYNSSVAGFDENSADVLIPAFMSAYTGSDVNHFSLDIFPDLLRMLPNWTVSYKGLSKIPFIKKRMKSLTLYHSYKCIYNVASFSSYSSYIDAGDGYGFVKDVLTSAPVPSSVYDVSSVTLTESFNPLLRIQGTFKNGITLNTEIRKTRTLNLSVSSAQVVEANQDQYVIGLGYKVNNFHPWGFMEKSKVKNELNVSTSISYKNQRSLLRKIEEEYSQASLGNKTFQIEFSSEYRISKYLTGKVFYDYESSIPLVSSYVVKSSDFGFSIQFSLNR